MHDVSDRLELDAIGKPHQSHFDENFTHLSIPFRYISIKHAYTLVNQSVTIKVVEISSLYKIKGFFKSKQCLGSNHFRFRPLKESDDNLCFLFVQLN